MKRNAFKKATCSDNTGYTQNADKIVVLSRRLLHLKDNVSQTILRKRKRIKEREKEIAIGACFLTDDRIFLDLSFLCHIISYFYFYYARIS